jgi:hypothetical protein
VNLHPDKLSMIKQRLACGRYEIDPRAIADAIIGSGRTGRRPAPSLGVAQKACSKPDSSSSASMNATPSPSRTDPTRVRPRRDPWLC